MFKMRRMNLILPLLFVFLLLFSGNAYAKLSKTVEVAIVRADLESITFTSDHGILVNNDSDWTDSGTPYGEPEWIKGTAINNPITHTKNTKLTINVTVRVSPAGLAFDLIGTGANYMTFEKTGNTSSGADQTLSITANVNLPDHIATLSNEISWKIKLIDPLNIEIDLGKSGPHKIYLTYGTPSGSVVTEKRMNWCVSLANGKVSDTDIADSIGPEAVNASHFGHDFFSLSNPWPVLGSNGDCGTLSTLMKKGLELLGVLGAEVRFVYPCHEDWSHLWSIYTNASERNLEGIKLGFMAPSWNNYEGTCFFKEKWWMGGAGTYQDSAYEVLRYWTLPNNDPAQKRQVWENDTVTPVPYPPGTP